MEIDVCSRDMKAFAVLTKDLVRVQHAEHVEIESAAPSRLPSHCDNKILDALAGKRHTHNPSSHGVEQGVLAGAEYKQAGETDGCEGPVLRVAIQEVTLEIYHLRATRAKEPTERPG
eukprot:TRINITY_DN15289_c0_g1_i3.p3 TRINITY_DN15289_c0_g1~~TRINITY_DN15289_c0_g1_i3.p3  ORF type:complete len:117 (+),score=12.74 TRINITY_DN15289_c0_g1_i3:285-635(+)